MNNTASDTIPSTPSPQEPSLRITTIAICSQTHASGRGHATDDHVHKSCRSFAATPEQEQIIQELANAIQAQYETDLRKRTDEWFENNPDETECCCIGEEFVGSTWIETNTYEGGGIFSNYGPTEQTIAELKRINENYTQYCDEIANNADSIN